MHYSCHCKILPLFKVQFNLNSEVLCPFKVVSSTMCGANNWPGTPDKKLIILISLAILLTFFLLSSNGCILDLGNSSSVQKSGCEGDGDWGGFLNKKCCRGAFQRYLYLLGVRANETGQIFLSSVEQRNCLIEISNSQVDMLSCGTEKLTTNSGGCSNLSVYDVNYRIAKSIKKFTEQCDFSDVIERWEQSCGSCLKSWKEMEGMQLKGADGLMEAGSDSDLCRLSVLVTSISARIKDEEWVEKLFKCLGLGSQHIDEGCIPRTKEPSIPKLIHFIPAGNNKGKSGLSIIIAGAIVGFFVILAVFTWIFLRRNSNSDSTVKKTGNHNTINHESKCLKIPIREVYSATNNLHPLNLIGEGTAGKVYKGMLSNNQEAAIKHLINDAETFLREIRSLSHVRHPNLVPLLGYCRKEGECFLVYELCPNGNLSQWLFGEEDKVLSWIQRIKIAIDSARGLCFLHTYPQGCIVHRDIKPANILLGANFEAKLSDFGLSKVIELDETNASSEVRGTFGYVDPEYQTNPRVNSAGDVYSFGIVLLQMLSGRKVVNIDTRKPQRLDKTAKSLTREGRKFEFADPRFEGEYSTKAFELVFELALLCTSPRQQLRPSMDQVIVDLEEALHLSTMARASTPVATPYHFSTPW